MRTNKTISFVLLIMATFFTGISSIVVADDNKFKDVVIKTVEVRDGIYMLMGAGGNIGVSIGNDGIFLIDDQYAPLTEKIKAAIAKLSDQPIKFLINTHWHGDHSGGNENLGKENVVIVAHDNVYARMSVDTLNAFGSIVPASPKQALPVITFNNTVTFRLNDNEIKAFHQNNAHTDGDSIIQFKQANVLHMGDIFFNGFYPFIDTSSEGSIDGIIQAVEQVLGMVNDKTKIIPGHGELADKKDLEKYLQVLTTVRSRMQKLINEGKIIDEIVAMKPLADYDDSLGAGFMKPEAFMRIVYDSLTR
jgi:cyclase